METKSDSRIAKTKIAVVSTLPIRVKRETKRRVLTELSKVNKKDFGKKVRLDDLLDLLLPLLTDAHIKQLQDSSMTNADRLEAQYKKHLKSHPGLSKDAFLGTLLLNENSKNIAEILRENKI